MSACRNRNRATPRRPSAGSTPNIRRRWRWPGSRIGSFWATRCPSPTPTWGQRSSARSMAAPSSSAISARAGRCRTSTIGARSISSGWTGTARYLKKLHEMTDALLEVGKDKFIVGMADWHPGGDCLAAFRDPQTLAVDMMEHLDEVKALLPRIEADYFAIYDMFYDKLRAAGQPITTWLPLVYEGKYYVPSNDFSGMISRTHVRRGFLAGDHQRVPLPGSLDLPSGRAGRAAPSGPDPEHPGAARRPMGAGRGPRRGGALDQRLSPHPGRRQGPAGESASSRKSIW